jgi:N-acetylneuraminate synthase
VEINEAETVILQRRSIRLKTDVPEGATLTRDSLTVLRPCPAEALAPYEISNVLGKRLRRPMKSGDHLRWNDIE